MPESVAVKALFVNLEYGDDNIKRWISVQCWTISAFLRDPIGWVRNEPWVRAMMTRELFAAHWDNERAAARRAKGLPPRRLGACLCDLVGDCGDDEDDAACRFSKPGNC